MQRGSYDGNHLKYLKPFVRCQVRLNSELFSENWNFTKTESVLLEKANFRKMFYLLGLNMKVTLMSSKSLWTAAGALGPHVPDYKDIPFDQKHSQNWCYLTVNLNFRLYCISLNKSWNLERDPLYYSFGIECICFITRPEVCCICTFSALFQMVFIQRTSYI